MYLQDRFPDQDVGVEYNRQGNVPKKLGPLAHEGRPQLSACLAPQLARCWPPSVGYRLVCRRRCSLIRNGDRAR
jgi:hypothetical protein